MTTLAKKSPVSATDPLADLWWNLLEAQRRALCELAYLDGHIADVYRWEDLPLDARIRLVRAMRLLSQLAVDCSSALELKRAALTKPAHHHPPAEVWDGEWAYPAERYVPYDPRF